MSNPNSTSVVNFKTVEEFNRWLGEIDKRIHAQHLPPPVVEKKEPPLPEGVGQLYFVAENVEAKIDDTRGAQRPQMLVDNDKGWTKVGWEW